VQPEAKQQSPARDRLRSLLVSALAIGLGLFHLYSARFGELVAYQHRAVHLAGMLALAFLVSSKSKGKRHFVSDVLAILSLVVGTYFVVAFKSIALRPGLPGAWDLVAAAAVLLLVLEASRRVVGPTLPILSVGFLVYTYLGDYVPGRFGHRGYSVTEILEYTSLTTEGIFGVALGVSSTYIVLFILFGAFLEKTGLMDFFNETALALAGRTRGGVAKVSVVSSALLGLRAYDTQCGAKLFRRNVVQPLFAEAFVSPWFFDLELYVRLRALSPDIALTERVCELSLTEWKAMGTSSLRMWDFVKVPLQLSQIYRRYR